MTGVDDEDLLVKSKSASFSGHGIIPPMNTPVLLIIVMLYTGFKWSAQHLLHWTFEKPGKDLVLVAKDIVHELLDDLTDSEELEVLAIVEGKL